VDIVFELKVLESESKIYTFISDEYLAEMSRNCGVPEMFIEDAVQEIRVRCWKRNDFRIYAVKKAAIDAGRKYGKRRRSFQKYTEMISFEDCEIRVDSDFPDRVIRILDAEKAWELLRPCYKRDLILCISDSKPKNNQGYDSRLYQARKAFRELDD